MKEVQNILKIETNIYMRDNKFNTKEGILFCHPTEITHCIVNKIEN